MHGHILIGTPAHAHMVTTTYLRSVFDLVQHFHGAHAGVSFRCEFDTRTIIHASRDLLATLAVQTPEISHLLFVDSDMGFRPELIEKMLRFDKPVVGVVYPQRSLKLERVLEVAREVDDPDLLQYLANRYVRPSVVAQAGDGGRRAVEVVDGFVRVAEAGTGVMLIRRDVLERMKTLPGLWIEKFEHPGYPPGLLQCFMPLLNSAGIPAGEDYSFCRRWVQDCGGEIWANVDEEITHHGMYPFKGKFIERLKRGR